MLGRPDDISPTAGDIIRLKPAPRGGRSLMDVNFNSSRNDRPAERHHRSSLQRVRSQGWLPRSARKIPPLTPLRVVRC